MYRLDLEIPGLPRMANARKGMSRGWRAVHYAQQRWKAEIIAMIPATKRPPTPLKYAKVTCVRYSSVRSDYDGRATGFKPVIDALVRARVIEDDSEDNIGMPIYLWGKAARGKGRIRVIVEELSEPPEAPALPPD